MINKNKAVEIRNDLEAAIVKIGKKHGIALSVGSVRYSPDSYKTSITGIVVGDGVKVGTPNAAIESDYNKNKLRWGANRSIGDTVTYAGKKFTFLGTKARNTKYPVIVESNRGARYKLPLSAIQ